MTEGPGTAAPEAAEGNQRLAILLAMAMFVLVVDTSLMNVSISAVVHDLDTTVSGVQSAIALEALVSAAFILIGSKVGDLIGRKRAYVLGLLGYAVGALAMALAQSLTAIIIFWAIVGGLGASLLLPAMQSLIHGNFEGAAQKKVYALVGAAAAIAAAVGPLLGGFITTYLSWRVGFLLEVVIIAIVLSGIRLVRDVPYTGPARGRRRRRGPVRRWAWAASCSASWSGRRAARPSARCSRSARSRWPASSTGSCGASARASRRCSTRTCSSPSSSGSGSPSRCSSRSRSGGTMIALPIYLQMVLEYNAMQAGLSLAPLSLSMFAVALLAGKKAGDRRPSSIIRLGFALLTVGLVVLIPIVPRADSGWYLVVPLLIAGSGLGLLVSQLNNYTLSPISEERVSEAAGVNSAAGSFGLSFGLAFAGAIMLATLSFTLHQHGRSRAPCSRRPSSSRSPHALEDDAEVMSNTQLEQLLADQPEDVRQRSSASTPTRGRSPFRWRCSSRSSPGSSGCSTRSA